MRTWIVISIWIAVGLSILVGCGGAFQERHDVSPYTYTRNEYMGETLREIPIWVDKDFGEMDRVSIEKAVEAWNYAMNGYVKLTVVDYEFGMEIAKIRERDRRNGWIVMKIGHDNRLVPVASGKYWTVGFADRVGGHYLYLVRDRLGNEDVFGVTLHEIGHLMGSEHVGERLMYPHYSRGRFQCVDWDTIVSVADAWDLDAEKLNYCVEIGSPSTREISVKHGEITEGPIPVMGLGEGY